MKLRIEKLAVIGGTVFTALGVIVILGIFWAERKAQTKRLEAVVISETRLLNPDIAKARRNLRILYGEKEVYDLSIMQIRIKNSGNQPIKSEDIEEPITILIEGVSEIVWAEVVSTDPPELVVSVENKGDCVEVSRTLLNPEDQFIVEVVSVPIEKSQPRLSNVKGRIAGIKRIDVQYSLRKAEERKAKFLISGLAIMIAAGLVVSISAFYGGRVAVRLRNLEQMTTSHVHTLNSELKMLENYSTSARNDMDSLRSEFLHYITDTTEHVHNLVSQNEDLQERLSRIEAKL